MSDDRLELRGKPQSVKRFNRKALIGIGAVTGLLVFGAAAMALRPPERADTARTELYNTTTKAMPDGLNSLPASYADVTPTLGPPMPGDLGAALIGRERAAEEPENPFQYRPGSSPTRTGGSAAPSARAQLADAARSSKLFFIAHEEGGLGGREDVRRTSPIYASGDPLAAFGAPDDAGANRYAGGGDPDPGRQGRKEAFFNAEVDVDVYNAHTLQSPISPYQVMAGTIIPASLITGLNSDLPGQVIAQVTENVYDTPTGEHLLIPQGSRLLGRYDSVIAYGQSRALVVWHRLIMPDGTSITIDNLPAVDMAGYAGLEDRVDYHSWRLFQAAILSSVLSVGSEIGRDSDEDILNALRDGGQRTINQAGQQVITKQLSVQPTITIRPGWRLRVIVNKDLVLQPYGG